jgi:hypothetical protein
MPDIKYVIGIPILAYGLYKVAGMYAKENELNAQTGGPDYTTTNLSRAKVSKWSKTALIANGFYDPLTGAPTPAFYALPAE